MPIPSFPGESVVGPGAAVHGRSPNRAGLSYDFVSQNSAKRKSRFLPWTDTSRDTRSFGHFPSAPRCPDPAIAYVVLPSSAFDLAVTATESTRTRLGYLPGTRPGLPSRLLPSEFRQVADLLRAFESHHNLTNVAGRVYNFYYKPRLRIHAPAIRYTKHT